MTLSQKKELGSTRTLLKQSEIKEFLLSATSSLADTYLSCMRSDITDEKQMLVHRAGPTTECLRRDTIAVSSGELRIVPEPVQDDRRRFSESSVKIKSSVPDGRPA